MERERIVHFLSELQKMMNTGDVSFNINPYLDQGYAEAYIANIKDAVVKAIKILSDSNDNGQSED